MARFQTACSLYSHLSDVKAAAGVSRLVEVRENMGRGIISMHDCRRGNKTSVSQGKYESGDREVEVTLGYSQAIVSAEGAI